MCRDSEVMEKARGAALELAEYTLKRRYGNKFPEHSSVMIEYGAHMFLMGILVDRRTSRRIEEFRRSVVKTEALSTDYYIEPLNDR